MNSDSSSEAANHDPDASTGTTDQPANTPRAVADIDDDFADVELGERQPEVCTMDEGCTTCQ